MRAQFERARRHGHGRYTADWPAAEPQAALAWCRETLAGTRRPWGLARFDATFTAHGDDGHRHVIRLRGLAPEELWTEGRLHDALTRLGAVGGSLHAALFAWGDAAYAAFGTGPG